MFAPGGAQMLPDLIATVILAGMMLIPLVNIIAGLIIGSILGGASGALAGFCLAFGILAAERGLIGLWEAHVSRRDEALLAEASEEVIYLQPRDSDQPVTAHIEAVLLTGTPAYVPSLDCAA